MKRRSWLQGVAAMCGLSWLPWRGFASAPRIVEGRTFRGTAAQVSAELALVAGASEIRHCRFDVTGGAAQLPASIRRVSYCYCFCGESGWFFESPDRTREASLHVEHCRLSGDRFDESITTYEPEFPMLPGDWQWQSPHHVIPTSTGSLI